MLSKHLRNLLRFSLHKNNFFIGKKNCNRNHLSGDVCSDVCCFYLSLKNIFTKSVKTERLTDVMFKLAFYCLSVTVEVLNL